MYKSTDVPAQTCSELQTNDNTIKIKSSSQALNSIKSTGNMCSAHSAKLNLHHNKDEDVHELIIQLKQ